MYLAQIEEHFSQKRRQGLILSPKDWLLAQEWRQQGIPLPVVLRGINRSFEQADSDKQIRSLSYCRAEVKRLWKEYKQQRAGVSPGKSRGRNSGSSYPPQLIALKTCLQTSMQQSHPQEVIEELRQLQELLERQLGGNWQLVLKQITRNLVCRLKEILASQERAALETDARRRLQGYESRMSEAAYRQTLSSLISEQLLEKYNLGPFSLYAE